MIDDFHKTAVWVIGPDKKLDFDAELPEMAGVYAHVSDGEVFYIGMTSSRPNRPQGRANLKKRLNAYRRRANNGPLKNPKYLNGTTTRVSMHIKKLVEAGHRVEVWTLVVDGDWYAVSEVETRAIQAIQPEWNRAKI